MSRKLRRLYEMRTRRSWNNDREFTASCFHIGQFAAQLVPFWVETNYQVFDGYLFHRCGFGIQESGLISLWMHTYYEIPSLSVWLDVGYDRCAMAATRGGDDMREHLIKEGVNVLDLMTLVR